MIVTFDTNILVYAADKRDPQKRTIAIDLMRQSAEAVLLWQVACEFIAASRKLEPFGWTTQQAWEQLSKYRVLFELIPPTGGVLTRAQELHVNHQWSFWDALIIGAAREAGVERIYSEDLPGTAPPGGPEIINPFA